MGARNCLSALLMFSTPLPGIHFHPLTTGGVLSLDGSSRIWALNETSAFIWGLLNEVHGVEDLADRFQAAFPISERTALRDVEMALTSFQREGLLAGGRPPQIPPRDESWDIMPKGPRLVEPLRWAVRRCFRAASCVFEFCCTDAGLAEAFVCSMSHLEVGCEESPDASLAVLSGQGEPQTWDIYVDGRRFQKRAPANMVMPHLATAFFVRCCEALRQSLLFHAAVVTEQGKAVAFPGEAGSGKTTLAAVLMAHGYQVFSDELAIVNAETLCVSPLPLPMSIKRRSIGPLSHYYPGLADGAVHLRTDGKEVCYLSPWRRRGIGIGDDSAQVVLLVFPMYREGAEDCLTAMDEAEAIQRLARTGSSNRVLTRADVEAMVSLVKSNPCYELVYTDVYRAAALLEKHVLSRYLRAE